MACPNEYPKAKLAMTLQPYIETQRLKDGYYRDYPGIRNGLKHVSYKRELKPIPNTLRLPEGIWIKIKVDGEETKCFRCEGDHLARDCTKSNCRQREASRGNKDNELVS